MSADGPSRSPDRDRAGPAVPGWHSDVAAELQRVLDRAAAKKSAKAELQSILDRAAAKKSAKAELQSVLDRAAAEKSSKA